MNTSSLFSSTYQKCISLLLTLVGTSLLVIYSACGMAVLPYENFFSPKENIVMKQPPTESSASLGILRDMTKGYWHSHLTKKYYCIEFKENAQSYSWNMSKCFDKTLFIKKQADIFQLARETGILTLTGKLDESESQGTYEFTEDSAFKKYLTDRSISSRDENFLFHLFLADMNKTYIAFLEKTYSKVDGNRLLELAIHGVSQKKYETYINLFAKYSNKLPSIQEVIEARIHGLDEEYIEQLKSSGFTSLSMKKMIETKIHGVDAAYIESLRKAGFANLSIDKILEAKIHGINATSIRSIESLGYTNLSLDKMIEVKIHGVTVSYIQDLESAGFTNLPLNKLIEAKIHGVNADFVVEAKNKGYSFDRIDEYIDLKIHGFRKSASRD